MSEHVTPYANSLLEQPWWLDNVEKNSHREIAE